MLTTKSERLVRLRIAGFRGVADELEIPFRDRRSLVLFAGNGTGKSTVADALEYYFTARIESLRRENREHCIPHIAPRQATTVEVQTTGVLGGSVGHPHPGLTKSPAVKIGRSEHFLLRGKDLAEFMDDSKREKAVALSRILGFADADELRADLQTTMHELENAAIAARAAVGQSAAALTKAGPAPDEPTVLRWIQAQCAKVGAEKPESIAVVLDERWQPVPDTAAASTAAKRMALASQLESVQSPAFGGSAVEGWNELLAGETDHERSRRALFDAANANLVTCTDELCPLCGQAVSLDNLRLRVAQTLRELETKSERFREADAALQRLISGVRAADSSRTVLARSATALGVVLPKVPPAPDRSLASARDGRKPAGANVVAVYVAALKTWDDAARAAGKTLSTQLDSQKTAEVARLGSVVTLARTWRAAAIAAAAADRARDLAKLVHNAYAAAFRSELEAVLDRLSERAGRIYAKLHPDQTAVSRLTLEVINDKSIELSVDFHGTRQRPPNGVLSESHLASLGLAVFMSMAETVNTELGFLVLDDPVSTFDADHRARLADVLDQEFGDRQLLVLTHDPLFYRRLARAGWNSLEFTSWSFDGGPTAKERDPDLLTQARAALVSADMQGAGSKGRRALEELLKEINEKLKVPVPFKRGIDNDLRVAEELLDALRGHLKDKAKHIAADLDAVLRALAIEIPVALNVETHASVYPVSPKEMETALDHVAALDAYFRCQDCNTPVWRHGTVASFRCKCGKRTMSLAAPPHGVGTSA